MIITCDSYCSMGYIYLQPSNRSEVYKGNKINKYIKSSKIVIPLLDGNEIKENIEKIKLMFKTYYEARVDNDFTKEYCNDLDEEGYMIGVELTLHKEDFIDQIKSQVYKVFVFEDQGKKYHFITLDELGKVLNSNNSMYPLTIKKDCFVVVEKKEETGYIKALISSRNDIYPLEYLLEPKFILSEYTLPTS